MSMQWNTNCLLLLLLFVLRAHGFVVNHHHRAPAVRQQLLLLATELDDIRAMRVKEIQQELKTLRVSTADVFEKEELVKRLYDARKNNNTNNNRSTSSASQNDNNNNSSQVIEGELLFFSQETGRSVAARNEETIRIEGVGQPYPAIQIRVENRLDLTLLLDTACSGFVLRPSVVRQHNLKTLHTPVTMTGAGGNANAGLAQVDGFSFGGASFGTMPAAVQDIGALPEALDGIIGLSFLKLFALVEMDLVSGKLRLYQKQEQIIPVPDDLEVVAEGKLDSTMLGIYTVDVIIDGKGPIKMLFDTGATSSFLSWQGVTDLGLSESMLEPLSGRMGAMGSDNVAMQLTHTLPVEIFMNLGRGDTPYKGIGMMTPSSTNSLSMDVGNIAILETQLKADGVVGILGMDVLQLCSAIRFSFTGSTTSVTLLK